MGDELKVISLLAIGLGLAGFFGWIAQKLKQSPLIGYLIAGFIIGPNSPGFSADPYITEQLATVGVTLLMFIVGLNFRWEDLLHVKKMAIPGAMILSVFSIFVAFLYSLSLGESPIAGFVMGIAVSVSSTVVIVRVLSDQGLYQTKSGHLILGWTIVEDLISVFGLLLLPALVIKNVPSTDVNFQVISQVLWVMLKIGCLGLIVYVIGEKLIGETLKVVARSRSHELFTLAVLSLTFMIAIVSSYAFGVSLALGAFISGVIIGKTDMSHQAAANALPLRDTFAAMFFLSVGMLFNPVTIMNNLPLFLGFLFIILFVRPLIAFLIVYLANYPTSTALAVGLAIAQIGEYSFIIAEEGSLLKILPDNAYDIIVGCAFVTISLNPILFNFVRVRHSRENQNVATLEKFLDQEASHIKDNPPQAIVVGFGPIGLAATTEMITRGYHVTVIDQNIDSITSLKDSRFNAIFGDATQSHILETALIKKASLLVITTPEFSINDKIIELAQRANSNLKIIARFRYKGSLNNNRFHNVSIICDEEATTEKLISLLKLELDVRA